MIKKTLKLIFQFFIMLTSIIGVEYLLGNDDRFSYLFYKSTIVSVIALMIIKLISFLKERKIR